ncbi:MAG: hypothetical protein WBP45_00540 [Daejeonella sp.]
MIRRRRKYLKLILLVLLYITLSNALFAQVKKERLLTGFYKVVAKSEYKVLEPGFNKTLFLDSLPICSIEDFKKVSLTFDQHRTAMIEIQLGDKGTEEFAKITKDPVGLRLAVIVDGELLVAPFVQSEITTGLLEISRNFPISEAQEIINKIKKGMAEEKLKSEEEK